MNVQTFPVLPKNYEVANLTPGQQLCYDRVSEAVAEAPVIALIGMTGYGKTILVRKLAREHHGSVVSLGTVAEALKGCDPGRMDEIISAQIKEAMRHGKVVVVDDFDKLTKLESAERHDFLIKSMVPHIVEEAARQEVTLVLVSSALDPWATPLKRLLGERAVSFHIEGFTSEDYRTVAVSILGADAVKSVDFKLLHQFAAMLTGHQLRFLYQMLSTQGSVSTDDCIHCLNQWILQTNVRTDKVEHLTFDSLPGSEEIAYALESNVILPFENPALAEEMGLKPKRGVLLYGPPGTGKTSIGRALAHRMQGKFFLIDGTFVSEPPTIFFSKVQAIVAEAKASSPCVLFIDDADLLFQISHIGGLARYLLTIMDGLESETTSNVCVVMTAMDVQKIPEALLRSGRVELWLETHAPDRATRERILQRWTRENFPISGQMDLPKIAGMTFAFTPADLRRLTEDAKLAYASDLAAGRTPATPTQYLEIAVQELIKIRGRMADQLGDQQLRIGSQR